MKSLTSLTNQKLNKFVTSFLPFQSFQVIGRSMLPTYRENQKLLVLSLKLTTLKKGDCVILLDPRTNMKILKRIAVIKQNNYFVVGDNKHESTDSRSFGWIDKKNIIGKVIYPV